MRRVPKLKENLLCKGCCSSIIYKLLFDFGIGVTDGSKIKIFYCRHIMNFRLQLETTKEVIVFVTYNDDLIITLRSDCKYICSCILVSNLSFTLINDYRYHIPFDFVISNQSVPPSNLNTSSTFTYMYEK